MTTRVLIAGPLTYAHPDRIEAYVEGLPAWSTVIVGDGEVGAERAAREAAEARDDLRVHTFYADYATWTGDSVPVRDVQMVDAGQPDLVVTFGRGKSAEKVAALAALKGIPVEKMR